MRSAPCLRTIGLVLLVIGLVNGVLAVPRALAILSDVWVWQNPLPQGNTFHGVSCPSATLCKAVGDAGTIYSWNGSSWSADVSPTTSSLLGVSCCLDHAVQGGGQRWHDRLLGRHELEHRYQQRHATPSTAFPALRRDAVQGGGRCRHDSLLERHQLERRDERHDEHPQRRLLPFDRGCARRWDTTSSSPAAWLCRGTARAGAPIRFRR